MKNIKLIGLLLASAMLLPGCTSVKPEPVNEPLELMKPTAVPSPAPASENSQITTNKEKVMSQAIISTSKGDFTVKLDPVSAPKWVENFTAKAKSDYYKNLTFHRVEDWVVQGGDPLGTGTGGGNIATELSQVPFKEGSVGAARAGDIRVSNDSQFFVCTKDCGFLTGQYVNFGEVTTGMEVVKKMEIGDKILEIRVE